MPMLSQEDPLPLYAQLAMRLRERIGRREWRESERLPSHDQLAGEYEVARVTVRQAIGMLESYGVVTSRRGRGTFVTAWAGERRRFSMHVTLGSMLATLRGVPPDMVTLDERPGMTAVTAEDGTAAPDYVRFRRLYRRDGIPTTLATLYLDERLFRRAPDQMRSSYIIEGIVAMPGVRISHAFQTVTAGAAEPDIAALLEIVPGAPIARLRRVLRNAEGEVVFLGEYGYRGDLVQFGMDLIPINVSERRAKTYVVS
jgi:GntR family transcriptional regulator